MRRRTLITGAAASGIGGITLIGTGAFDTASAERTATVNFADDEDAYLGLVSKSAYATTDGDGELALAFGDVSGDGDGIGRNSQFFFDEVFAIANQGTETVSITASSDTDAFDGEFRLYPTGDRDGTLDDGDNAIVLETGEEQSVGTHVETGDVDVTNELDIEITIEAAFEEGGDEPDDPEPEPPETIDSIELYSTASQIAADGESELADDSVVAVTASDDGINYDQNGTDPVIYEDNPIPLVSVDGASPVAGLGTMQLINDETDFGTGSEEFTLNLMDDLIGSGTVLWDESHGQYWTLGDDGNNSFEAFADYAGNNGYSLEATDELEADLSDADGVAIGTPADEFTDSELTALSDFVDDGGGVLLLDQSDFGDNEETATLNEIATELDLDFRFNSDQVEDPEGSFSFTTSEFNTDEFDELFEDREGIQ